MVHVFHQAGSHGRVFRGLDALNQMHNQKRDSHGSHIKLHVPEGYNKQVSNDDVATVYSVVYVTASGPAPEAASDPTPTVSASPTLQTAPLQRTRESTSTSASLNADESAYAAAKSAAQAPHVSSSVGVAATSAAASSTVADSTSSAAATPLLPAATVGGAAAVVGGQGGAVQATRPASSIEKSGGGMSGGQQAGLAIGILAAFALAAGLLWFCWRKRKTTRNKDQNQLMDEKHGSFFGSNQATPNDRFSNGSIQSDKVPASVRSTRTASVAPRLSLRPVTQFLPNLAGGDRKSTGNTLNVASAPMTEKSSSWERRPAGAPEDPFADAAVLNEKRSRPSSSESGPKNPFDEPEGKASERSASPTSTHTKNGSGSWQGSEPPTPKSVKLGTAAAVSIQNSGPAAPPVPTQPNNVHRVQLDFKPSMDDELELRSGQLVRMLHEYDDGWALCIRMDRSQQGVVPRTCLSKLPVKPRNSPPPNSQRQPYGQRRPSNPNGPMYPRPLTPTGASPQGNRQRAATGERSAPHSATEGRNRSQSEAQKSMGTSMPSRKPVPGQAM